MITCLSYARDNKHHHIFPCVLQDRDNSQPLKRMGMDVHKIRVGWESAADAGGVEAGQRRLGVGELLGKTLLTFSV